MSNVSSTSAASATQIAGYLNTSQTLSALTGTTPTTSIAGLVSGINTTSLISALMQQASEPQTQLQTQLTSVKNQLTDWSAINSDATQLQTAADAVNQLSGWQVFQAASSSSAVTATVGNGATGGNLTFTVGRLAQASSLVSNNTVGSLSAQVTSASSLLLAQGGSAIGLGALSGNLGSGTHTISVTTAALGATVTGGSALPTSTTVTAGSNDTIDYSVNGQAESLTLAPGTNLSPSQLAAEITSASNGLLTASTNSSGALQIATTAQGSSQSLQITGGDALSSLGLSTGAAVSGQDGVVSVDGVANTLSDVNPGSAVTLNGANGATLQATITGPLDAGSITADQISTGNGSLNNVIDAVNTSGLGITASAVQVGGGNYRLELTSNTTGANSDIDLDPTALDQVGGTSVLTAGQDAQLTVGDGPGAFNVTSATNTVNGLLPGVTLQLDATSPTTPVTVSLTPDAATMASKVSTLVSAANAMITDLNTAMTLPTSSSTTSSSTGNTALEGLLLGNSTANGLLHSILNAVSSQTVSGSTGSAGLVGITMGNNGLLTFDQTAFETAYSADPTSVAETFTQGSSTSNAYVSMYEATDATNPGTYSVNVTQAATQASVTGATVAGGAVSTPETLTLQASGGSATYQTTAGESLSDVAAGINAATAAAGVGVEAAVDNGALTLTGVAWGSGGNFSVSSSAAGAGTTGLVSSANTAQSYTGQDVAGTIDGVAATGTGQLLLGALNTSAQGMLLQVTATQSEVTAAGGDLGSVTYTPGVAQSLASAALAASNPVDGSITNVVNGLNSQSTNLQTQITNWNPILAQQQQSLQQEYANMETALAGLDSTKSQLAQAFGGSTTSSSSGG